jgi:hypothetical protein
LARARAASVFCERLNSLAAARAAASVAVRSSVRTSCIQATSTANAAMMMHSGRQIATSTSMAARRRLGGTRRFMVLVSRIG